MSKKKHSLIRKILPTVLVVLVAVVGIKCWSWLSDNKLPNARRTVELFVYPSTTPEDGQSPLDAAVSNKTAFSALFLEENEPYSVLFPTPSSLKTR